MAMACFFDQVLRDNAVDDTQHPAHDLGPAGKQETQKAVHWYSDFRVLSLALLALTALVVGAFA